MLRSNRLSWGVSLAIVSARVSEGCTEVFGAELGAALETAFGRLGRLGRLGEFGEALSVNRTAGGEAEDEGCGREV